MFNVKRDYCDFGAFHNRILEKNPKTTRYIIMNKNTYSALFNKNRIFKEEDINNYNLFYEKFNEDSYLEYGTYNTIPIAIWNRLRDGEVDLV